MSFQTTADLETLSKYSRRARGGGRETNDDSIGMILPTECMESPENAFKFNLNCKNDSPQ